MEISLEAWRRGVGFSLNMLFPLSPAMTNQQEIKNHSKGKIWEGIRGRNGVRLPNVNSSMGMWI